MFVVDRHAHTTTRVSRTRHISSCQERRPLTNHNVLSLLQIQRSSSIGTEEGSIHPCHRYDRAGAKAGVDSRLVYRTPQTQPGYGAPVTSTQFHPSRGPIDVTDVLLSTSADWTIKLWRMFNRPQAPAQQPRPAMPRPPPQRLNTISPTLQSPSLDIPYPIHSPRGPRLRCKVVSSPPSNLRGRHGIRPARDLRSTL